MEGDTNKFILTSRSTNGTVESFVLHSSHPGVREVWTLQISQILDSQRNFLNGRRTTHNNMAAGPLLEKNRFLYGWQLSLVLTALTSPIEYQRNHVGPSGGSCTPSVGAPSGGSSGSTVPHGVGGGIQGNAIPSGPQGGSRRPSRIPQPSRLPQPLRHHPGAEAEGPSKMSGIKHLSVSVVKARRDCGMSLVHSWSRFVPLSCYSLPATSRG